MTIPEIFTEQFTVGVGDTNLNTRARDSILKSIRRQILMVFFLDSHICDLLMQWCWCRSGCHPLSVGSLKPKKICQELLQQEFATLSAQVLFSCLLKGTVVQSPPSQGFGMDESFVGLELACRSLDGSYWIGRFVVPVDPVFLAGEEMS